MVPGFSRGRLGLWVHLLASEQSTSGVWDLRFESKIFCPVQNSKIQFCVSVYIFYFFKCMCIYIIKGLLSGGMTPIGFTYPVISSLYVSIYINIVVVLCLLVCIF
jgi:hypothetical protein